MMYCLSHFTAFNMMMSSSRLMGRSDIFSGTSSCNGIPDYIPSVFQINDLVTRYGQLPVHSFICPSGRCTEIDVLVSSMKGIHKAKNIRAHVDERSFNSKLVAPIDTDREGSIVCPELVFLELASKLDLIGTIAAGYALCSTYYLDSSAPGGVSLRKDAEQLTSVSKLLLFISKNAGKRGARKAKVALQYIHDAARSPREIALAMLFCLPMKYGGFGLGDVRLNVPIKVPIAGEKRFVTRMPDLLITAKGQDGKGRSVALDYDPISTHGRKEAEDLSRKNQIVTADKFPHLSLTKENVRSFSATYEVAWQIRRILKKRIPKGAMLGQRAALLDEENDVYGRQWELWNRLFRSM